MSFGFRRHSHHRHSHHHCHDDASGGLGALIGCLAGIVILGCGGGLIAAGVVSGFFELLVELIYAIFSSATSATSLIGGVGKSMATATTMTAVGAAAALGITLAVLYGLVGLVGMVYAAKHYSERECGIKAFFQDYLEGSNHHWMVALLKKVAVALWSPFLLAGVGIGGLIKQCSLNQTNCSSTQNMLNQMPSLKKKEEAEAVVWPVSSSNDVLYSDKPNPNTKSRTEAQTDVPAASSEEMSCHRGASA